MKIAAYPLDRVLELVRTSDAYILIVAWRYGFVPDASRAARLPHHAPHDNRKSITEWEYLAAKEKVERPILPFILADSAPWSPRHIDGFDPGDADGHASAERVRQFRAELMSEHITSFFTTADDLESLVGAAVASARISRQVEINRIGPGKVLTGQLTSPDSSYAVGLAAAVRDAVSERVITIDITTDWWSTRLYLLAFLSARFTSVQRILVVAAGEFVGLLPLQPTIRGLATVHPEVKAFEDVLRSRSPLSDVEQEVDAVMDDFRRAFPPHADNDVGERHSKLSVTRANLHQWFREALMTNALSLSTVEQASPLDLVRIFDYPGDYVPVIVGEGSVESEQSRCHVIDKGALSVQLARAYVTDLLDDTRT